MAIMRSQLKSVGAGGNFFLPRRDLNHGPLEPKVCVLPMNYADSLNCLNLKSFLAF